MAGILRQACRVAVMCAVLFAAGLPLVSPVSAQSVSPIPDSFGGGSSASPALRVARGAREDCNFPWTYSRGLRRCVCVREGYNMQAGDCLPEGVSGTCRDDERWSAEKRSCVCGSGLQREGIRCVAASGSEEIVDAEEGASAEATPKEVLVAKSQRCFAALGFYQGPSDGRVSPETWTAYWYFKHAHDLKRHSDFLDEAVQTKIAALCQEPEATASIGEAEHSAEPVEAEPSPAHAVSEPAASPSIPPSAPEVACLPGDLLDLLQQSRRDVAAVRCEAECLARPAWLDEADLAEMAEETGLAWCSACVGVQGRLTLEDVRRIESAGGIELCATPSKQMPRDAAASSRQSYTRVRELYRNLAATPEDPAGIAVIIGNGNYASLPARENALNDAGAVTAFLTEHLGFRSEDVIDVRDATKADLDRLFGAGLGGEGELARRLKANPAARLVVYYSGHGAVDAAQTEAYLLPVDTERYRDERSGYPLKMLYANLERLGADSVLLLMEADFGRDHGPYVMPPNAPETRFSVVPVVPTPGLTILAAADRGQRALIDPAYGVGLFTRYLIEGLAGGGDLPPVGNADGKLDSVELHVFTASMVRRSALKTFGLLQRPVYSAAAPTILSTGKGTFAARPN
jgi:hypothetical protein